MSGVKRATSAKVRLRSLLNQADNRTCADCGAPDPKWASANIGVFLCLKCCGVHRSLGTHISKVLSVALDEWSDEDIDAMIEVGGNSAANSIYEAHIPDGYTKPGPNATNDERRRFIMAKYELQEFMKPSLRIKSGRSSSSSSVQSSISGKIIDTVLSQKSEGMVEFIGLLKVKVVNGTNLAIRDMMTSDPYVVLTLGQQTAQTTVKSSDLNPVWNEDLMLSVPNNYRPVKLQVYDHDTFSADDIMGEAEIDIQPLITSATSYGDPQMFGDMQIGKWLKSRDNALFEDSIVKIADGRVKQEVSLQLQNVESGEIYLEIEWLPLDHFHSFPAEKVKSLFSSVHMGIFSEAHVCQCLSRLATQKRHSLVTTSGDRQKTGQQFVESVLSLARGLLQLGLRNGDVVAISAFNSDWYLEWILAVAFIGGIVAPLNYRWSFEEARMAMVTIRPKLLVTDESCYHWHCAPQGDAIPSLRWHVSLSSPSSDVINKCNTLTVEMLVEKSVRFGSMNYSFAPEGAVLICFTSGTTGRPKGVVISHAALIVQSLAKVAIVGYSEDDVYLHTTPLCHIGGLSSAMAMLMVGACHIFMPKFEASLALKAIEQHHVTSLITVPAIMADLISSTRLKQSWKGSDSVKKILNGGGGLSDNLIKDATTKLFPKAKLLSAYGMTETCSSLAFMTLFEPMLGASDTSLQMLAGTNPSPVKTRGVCVGKPAPHVEIKICNDGSSNVGRILTRGPHVMLRYWDHQIPEKASHSIEETWLDTGDIGFVDNHGNLWLVGRTNGRIKSGGENIYPEEVEAVLIQHPGVLSSIVVGIPDPRLAEVVVACIRLRDNWKWSDDSSECSVQSNQLFLSSTILRHYCREKNLTGFKIPKMFISWRTQFPLTTTGKIRREQVRREVMSQLVSFPSNL
ncbi:hypothetical protein V6N13_138584 [Hibiscus sabdariffa]|uniref:Uncharacterized protein n=2 Tax=Hibiscus sabdariffa TaxID=183260 RepID=A0ABR2A542_9ROSI